MRFEIEINNNKISYYINVPRNNFSELIVKEFNKKSGSITKNIGLSVDKEIMIPNAKSAIYLNSIINSGRLSYLTECFHLYFDEEPELSSITGVLVNLSQYNVDRYSNHLISSLKSRNKIDSDLKKGFFFFPLDSIKLNSNGTQINPVRGKEFYQVKFPINGGYFSQIDAASGFPLEYSTSKNDYGLYVKSVGPINTVLFEYGNIVIKKGIETQVDAIAATTKVRKVLRN